MTNPIPGVIAGRLLAALAVAASCVSCSSSKGGKPTVICGKEVSHDPAGAVIEDAAAHDITVTRLAVGDVILLRTTSSCHAGADVAIEPSGAADIVNDVRSPDGRYTAVMLQPHRSDFTVRVTRSPKSVSVVTVQGVTPVEATSTAP